MKKSSPTRFLFLSLALWLPAMVPATQAAVINWTTGTAGDASGAWSGAATTFNGQSYAAGDDLIIDGTASKTITLSGTVTAPASLTISATGTPGNTVASSAGVAGAGAITLTGTSVGGTLIKTGNVDLVLAAANTFGAVSLSGGKIFLNNAGGLGTTGTLTVASGAASGVNASYGSTNNGPDKFFYDSSGLNASYTFSKNIAFDTVGSATTYGLVMRGGQTRTTTLSGNITGASNITMWLDASTSGDGASIWRLTGDNSGYAGNIRLNRGRLFLDNANASGTGAIVIQSNGTSGTGGTVVFNFSGTLNNSQITLNSGGGGINYVSTGTNNVTITGNVVSTSASVNSGLAKAGTGMLTLTNTVNDMTNPTTVAEGTLTIGGAGRLNSGAYAGSVSIATGATFDYSSSAAQTLSGAISGTGTLTKSGAGVLTLSGANASFTGTINANTGRLDATAAALGGATIIANASYGGTYASAGTPFLRVTDTGNMTVANNIVLPAPGATAFYALQKSTLGSSVELSGVISGGNANTVFQLDTPNGGDSTTNFTLSGNNTFTGTLRVNRGTLTLTNANAAGTASIFLQTNPNTGGNLRFTSSFTLANNITINTSGDDISTEGNDVVLSGVLSGVSSWSKRGEGTLTLAGVNTHSGNTTVAAGTLAVASTGRTGSGIVTLQTGSTILGTGLVRGSSFIAASGATVQAGADGATGSYGTLTFTPASGSGSFNFQSGSSIVLGLNPGGTGDLLSFNGLSAGTLTFNGDMQITAAGYVPTSVETFNLLDWANVGTPTFASRYQAGSYATFLLGNGDDNLGFDLPDIAGSGYGWDISQFTINGTIRTVVFVPEPGRAMLVLLGLGVVAGRRGRRRAGLLWQ